jgi:hypothetical protein
MLLLGTILLATSQSANPAGPVAPRVQALATVRIVRGEAIRFGEAPGGQHQPPLREIKFVLPDGSRQTAKVVEFE